MADEVRLIATFALAALIVIAATPLAIRIAHHASFYDRPSGYKGHREPTPYLGGAAVFAGFLLAGISFAEAFEEFGVLMACAAAMLVLGTIDDRIGLSIAPRLLGASICGGALFVAGMGWEPFALDLANAAMTVIFVLGVINAYNLMDNLDGAAATVAATTALLAGIYLAAQGDPLLAALALAAAGACVGFLPYNLSRPAAKIFLGDGGSMVVGVVVAALIMNLPHASGFGWELVAVGLVMVGLPGLDTALVIVSRLRRGASMLRGARDHLTHRVYARIASTTQVAWRLALGQGFFVGFGILLLNLDDGAAIAGALACVVLAAGVIVALELPGGVPAIGQRQD